MVDWSYAYTLCKDASEDIRAAGYMPEVVIGVARGGWYLARVLCDLFLLKDLLSVKVEHWGLTATITGDARLKCGLDVSALELVRGKRVLIADDVTDTGDSLRLIAAYLESSGANEVKTVTMHHKTTSSYAPDFYGELMTEWTWILYPWSIIEDVLELCEHTLAKTGRGLSLCELRDALKVEFDLYVPYSQLREVVETAEWHGRLTRQKEEGKEVWSRRR
ncbi:MAG: phosphoribosyltransferase [Methanomicrobia archaeon]|nr:phosphoribosyltransferase [Methanomicrobia archaeon]